MSITLPPDNAAPYTWTQPIRDGLARVNDIGDVVGSVIPISRLATGTPTGTKFIRDDGTLAVPPGGGSSTENTHAITASGATTLDPAVTGTYKIVTMTANSTFTFGSGVAGQVVRMDVHIIENATGGWTITWPTIKWQAGVVPTHVTNANSISLYTFWNPNNLGWYGAVGGQGFA